MSKQVREYENKLKIKVTEMSSREISNAKTPPSAREILKLEYPTIYNGYKEIQDEQFELFAKKHLDYGMHNVSAGTNLENADEIEFAMTGLWYRLSDKINRWKNMIISGRKAQNETLIDTFQDVTNYGIIAQLVSRGMWKNDK
jgi:predicted ABC-class ATPase